MKLHIKSKLLSIHDRIDVMDEADNILYRVSSKALSIKDKTCITNEAGDEVANIHSKVMSIHNVYFAEMSDGMEFEVSEELFHLTKDILNIDSLGWQIRGDITSHDYEIVTEEGRVLATAHRKWLSLHNVYYLDVVAEEKMDIIVTLFVILEHLHSKQGAISSSTNDAQKN